MSKYIYIKKSRELNRVKKKTDEKHR
jgi:hypothetical protein